VSRPAKLHEIQSYGNTEPEELPFIVELKLDDNRAFYDILLEAIDKSFSSLGELVRTSIYFYLENSMGIEKSESPFRIIDFQSALEKLFGAGTRHLELLVIKNLHEKIKIKYKGNMSRWVVPYITSQEYIRLAKMAYENSNEKSNELGIEYAGLERE
jgi:hypothetical protein